MENLPKPPLRCWARSSNFNLGETKAKKAAIFTSRLPH
jgi:hypothetical protein